MIHHISAINGAAFKGNLADGSYVACPFNFVLGLAKSIGFWIQNNGSFLQVAFRNVENTHLVYFNSGAIYIKTSAGTTYTLSVTNLLQEGTLNFVVITITDARELKVTVSNVEYTLATLDFGEVLDFSTGIQLGRSGGGVDGLQCVFDDFTMWNRSLNANEINVLYNRRMGSTPNRIPFSGDLQHYLSFDNMGIIKDQVDCVVTGTTCFLKGAAYEYFNQSAMYFNTNTDYVVGPHANWDNSVMAAENNLTFTFIIRPDVTRGVDQAGQAAVLCSYGTTGEADSFTIYYGSVGSGEYMGGLYDQAPGLGKGMTWVPDGDDPRSYPAGVYLIQSYLLTPTGSYIIHNGKLVHSAAGMVTPLLAHTNYTGGYRLGKAVFSSSFYHPGAMREHSVIRKAQSVADVITMHKKYLGLDPGDSVDGVNTSVLRTTNYNLMDDGFEQADFIGYWPGFRVDGWGDPSITGTIVKDVSGNNRHLNLMNYTFPTDPTVKRRGNKIIS